MQLNPIFSISIGTDSLAEHLPIARELFADNKDNFKYITTGINTKTTLENYYVDTVKHRKDKKFNIIQNDILIKAKEYASSLGYAADTLKFKIKNIWLNEMVTNSSHNLHYHYGSHISGCFYIDVPQNSGVIVFSHINLAVDTLECLGVKQYTPANSVTWRFEPKEGDIYFWKSTLQHEVPLLKFDGTRRCIAFDIDFGG
jgi:uncharacterized protein (TIGR02466 family)